ncbi:VOC family protein [Actinoallomurus acanthiterrae]
MSDSPRLTLSAIVLESPDARELAGFYRRLLGWDVVADEPDWVKLTDPDGGVGLSFQTEKQYVRPVWPTEPGHQQMLAHLDIKVDDLDAAVEHAVAAGAEVADHQPLEGVRICLDPAGHPFCLFLPGA